MAFPLVLPIKNHPPSQSQLECHLLPEVHLPPLSQGSSQVVCEQLPSPLHCTAHAVRDCSLMLPCPTHRCLSHSRCSVCTHWPEPHPNIYRINAILITLAGKTLCNHAPRSFLKPWQDCPQETLHMMRCVPANGPPFGVWRWASETRSGSFPLAKLMSMIQKTRMPVYYFTIRKSCGEG